MSIYDKASLVQIPSGYKGGGTENLYSVVPNDADGDFDYSGGTNGTRVNKDGLIETIAADTPRLNYPLLNGVVQSNPTLLLEPQRTNSTTYSEDFTQTSYWGNVVDVVATTNQTTAPDGSNTGNKIQANSGTNFKILRTGSFTIPSGITMSMFVKRGNHDYILFKAQGDYNFNLNTLTWGDSYSNVGYELYPNDWVRLYATTSSSVLSYFGIYLTDSSFNQSWNATGNEYVYVWGAQYETGSYPTSYIKTQGETNGVTRSADAANGAEADFNDSEGVYYVNTAALVNDSTTKKSLINNSGAADNRVMINLYQNSISGNLVANNGVSQQVNLSATVSDITIFNKIAVKYKNNDSALWVNGFEADTSTGDIELQGLDEFRFDQNLSQAFLSSIKEMATFNEALSDTELETLTSYRSFNSMAKELLFTIE